LRIRFGDGYAAKVVCRETKFTVLSSLENRLESVKRENKKVIEEFLASMSEEAKNLFRKILTS